MSMKIIIVPWVDFMSAVVLMVHIMLHMIATCKHGLMRIHMILSMMMFTLWTILAIRVMIHMMRFLCIGAHVVEPS